MMILFIMWMMSFHSSFISATAFIGVFAISYKLSLEGKQAIILLLTLEFLSTWIIFTMVSPFLQNDFTFPLMFLIFTLSVCEGSYGLSMLIMFYRIHNSSMFK